MTKQTFSRDTSRTNYAIASDGGNAVIGGGIVETRKLHVSTKSTIAATTTRRIATAIVAYMLLMCMPFAAADAQAQGPYSVTVQKVSGEGHAEADKTTGLSAGDVVEVTFRPNTGYELAMAETQFEPDTLWWRRDGGSAIKSRITMPASNVKIYITFEKTNPQLEVEAIKAAIESITELHAPTTVTNDADFKSWLADEINNNIIPGLTFTKFGNVFNVSYTVNASSITVTSFTPRTDSSDGSFTFTVSLQKPGGGNPPTSSETVIATASGTITALVNAQTPVISGEPQNATVNAGDNVTLTVAASISDGGAISYQWYSNTTNSNTGGNAINGATNSSYSPPTASAGTTTYYYVVVTNTNNSVNGTTTATATSNVAEVKVNALVNAQPPVIREHPQDATVNVGGNVTLEVEARVQDGGTLSYQWYSNTTNSNTGGSAINGATNKNYSPSTSRAGARYYYVVVTNTNNSVNGNKIATTKSHTATVTVNIPIPTYYVNVAATTNGAVTVNPATAQQAGATITLTIAPASGYELESITTTPAVVTRLIASLRYEFTMPASNVTVNATFKKTQAQLDREGVETAAAAIKNGNYRVSQATANSTASVKAWLTNRLNVLFGQSQGLQIDPNLIVGEVKVANFAPAYAGTEANPGGSNGSFTFTVSLTLGSAKITLTDTKGVIVATPYAATTVKRIELLRISNLTTRILNTGNVASGTLTLALSGANANVFTLPQATVNSLAAGGEADVTLAPKPDLAKGTYTATLRVGGEGLASVSIRITYTVTDTGNENPQSSALKAYVQNGILHVGGLTAGQLLSIYNISGALAHQSKVSGSETEVSLSARGAYIVTSDGQTVKVVY